MGNFKIEIYNWNFCNDYFDFGMFWYYLQGFHWHSVHGTEKLFSSSENCVLQALANCKTKEYGLKLYRNIDIKLLSSLMAYLKILSVTNAHPTL